MYAATNSTAFDADRAGFCRSANPGIWEIARLIIHFAEMTQDTVSLVIPGRDCASTIGECLDAVVPLVGATPLKEIIFVDDGSTDATAEIVKRYDVQYVVGTGKGAGAARNIGWQRARNPLVWFIDSDCVAEPDALTLLLPHLDDRKVGAVGGSYGNMASDSLLACLIHEEIVERHMSMPSRVDVLATFNVLYRRSILQELNGFDERFLKGQDAELSWRVLEAGYELGFELNSRVKHFHPVALRSYLRTQRQQGHWRVWLHLTHRGHSRGDSYSKFTDHIQPPVALLTLATLALASFEETQWIPVGCILVLGCAQIPMTWRLLKRKRQLRYKAFAAMSFLRAFWRGAGMLGGVCAALWSRFTGQSWRRDAQ
ncbi:MAG: glycosyltransferase [Phycisphaerales bacterium]|nr:MAG: glycosyltransferase [Phycisphaerales bacterium]